jgi:hypothetical protein
VGDQTLCTGCSVHPGLPEREQHPRGGQEGGRQGSRMRRGSASTATSRASSIGPRRCSTSPWRASTARMPPARSCAGQRHRARPRGPQLRDVQPVHRHQVLHDNCPYKVRRYKTSSSTATSLRRVYRQGYAGRSFPSEAASTAATSTTSSTSTSFRPVSATRSRDGADAEESQRHRPHARRDGEVLLLHPAINEARMRASSRTCRASPRVLPGRLQQACPSEQVIVFGDMLDVEPRPRDQGERPLVRPPGLPQHAAPHQPHGPRR